MIQHPDSPSLATLASLIARHTKASGDFPTLVPNLTLHRRATATAPIPCIYSLGLGVIAQGGKQVLLHDSVIDYRAGQGMLTSIDQPVVARVSEGSVAEPFLGMMLTLDMHQILQTAAQMQPPPPSRASGYRTVVVDELQPGLLSALERLLGLLDEPALIAQLAPLIQQEIIVRLLAGPYSLVLQQLLAVGSPTQQIFRTVAWLKQNFTHALRIDDLAQRAHMSPSSFRQHFRAIIGVSPLQFHKQLRLQEARQLMLSQNLDVGRAAGLVGYESASQFSREYSRVFGAPPQRDIRRMRETG
ncbi:AraC family transcriptional regulator [Pseudomonas sp. TNT2022 ID1048]|uniref:AraC family transcriptional regulator n=1 Tax=Pseudomonas idahonensis TaxID=2942628 RepID=UPI00235F4158|nr:AraC family transcriptional regulator [Pseudomonas idahonensis]MDD1018681.1 AraC family transcriptional regulator [Pseudomonas idahonensis]